jgi:hypothetical protein
VPRTGPPLPPGGCRTEGLAFPRTGAPLPPWIRHGHWPAYRVDVWVPPVLTVVRWAASRTVAPWLEIFPHRRRNVRHARPDRLAHTPPQRLHGQLGHHAAACFAAIAEANHCHPELPARNLLRPRRWAKRWWACGRRKRSGSQGPYAWRRRWMLGKPSFRALRRRSPVRTGSWGLRWRACRSSAPWRD